MKKNLQIRNYLQILVRNEFKVRVISTESTVWQFAYTGHVNEP